MFLQFTPLICLSFVFMCSAHVRTVTEPAVNQHIVHHESNIDDSSIDDGTAEVAEYYEYLNKQSTKSDQHQHQHQQQQQYACESEVFTHYYIISSTRVSVMNNTWQRTAAFESGVLEHLCLLPSGLPVQRKCLFSNEFKMAIWQNISHWPPVKCYSELKENNTITLQMHNLYQDILDNERSLRSKQDRSEVMKYIASLVDRTDYKPLPADIYYAGKLLTVVTANGMDAALKDNVMDIFNKVATIEPTMLRISAEVNATNLLLDAFETYMDSLSDELLSIDNCHMTALSEHDAENVACLGVRIESSPEINIFFINPRIANISGIAIYENSTNKQLSLLKDSTNNTKFRYLYLNESTDMLLKDPDLVAATFLPHTTWLEVMRKMVHKDPPVIVIKLYKTDNVFVDSNLLQSVKPFSKIISITIPKYDGQFSVDLPFILRSSKSTPMTTDDGCGYWNYSSWIKYRNYTRSNQNLILCNTNHLTQFGYLVGGLFKQNDPKNYIIISPFYQKSLDIVSIIGCSLSLLGLLGIWLTAILFPKWRMIASRKVLLHLCFALTLQLILFLFVNTNDMAEYLIQNQQHNIACVVLGALMQYVILVLFMWMLCAAYLQFQRYVTVLGDLRPPHYVLKSALISWGLPLIPTLLTSCLDPMSYIPSEFQLTTNNAVCYPSGMSLIFGVIVPITIIVLINLTIFVLVFHSISRTLSQPMQRAEKKHLQKKIQLSILLFFILGIPWIFGIYAFIRSSLVYSYLFCATATLQGFILFIFYVVLDDIANSSWQQLLCSRFRKKAERKSREMQFMTTSTNLENN